jgi:hypothetical protein
VGWRIFERELFGSRYGPEAGSYKEDNVRKVKVKISLLQAMGPIGLRDVKAPT